MSSGRKKTNKCLEGNKRNWTMERCVVLNLRDHMVTHRASVRRLHSLRLLFFIPRLASPTTPPAPPAWAEGSSRRLAAVRASCKRISAPLCSSDIIFPPRRLRPHEASSPVSRLLLFLLPPPLPLPTSPHPRGSPAACILLSIMWDLNSSPPDERGARRHCKVEVKLDVKSVFTAVLADWRGRGGVGERGLQTNRR